MAAPVGVWGGKAHDGRLSVSSRRKESGVQACLGGKVWKGERVPGGSWSWLRAHLPVRRQTWLDGAAESEIHMRAGVPGLGIGTLGAGNLGKFLSHDSRWLGGPNSAFLALPVLSFLVQGLGCGDRTWGLRVRPTVTFLTPARPFHRKPAWSRSTWP